MTPYAASQLRASTAAPSSEAVPVDVGVGASASRIGRALLLAVLGGALLVAVWSWITESGQRQAAAAQAARQAAAHDRARAAIDSRQVYIGMAAADVRASWGDPSSINSTTTAAGTVEQWVYRWENGKQQYVYIDGGRVRSMQAVGQ